MKKPIEEILIEIHREYETARSKFRPFKSTHEAYAILLEEVDELWEAIKNNQSNYRVKEEAIQIAAMALGIVHEFPDEEY